jgi:glycosyltransferase involved in cell wall biosynthesis
MLKNKVTIIIPCKNEGVVIKRTLDLINLQNEIEGTRVIVADCSDDNDFTRNIILSSSEKNVKLEIIEGGYPAYGRNRGAEVSETPYILFMDSDIFLGDQNTLSAIVNDFSNSKKHLATTRMRTNDGKYNYVYKIFDFIQKASSLTTPFAIGGFMLFERNEFNRLGGFVDEDEFAEDYHLSSKIKPSKFKIYNETVYTTSRRFKNKGLRYMVTMMAKSWINRNNDGFFKKDHGYWT